MIAIDAQTATEVWRLAVAHQPRGWPLGPFAAGGVAVAVVDDAAPSSAWTPTTVGP